MHWIVEYDYAALMMCTLVICVYYFSRRFPTFTNKVYQVFLTITFLSIIGDIGTAHLSTNTTSEYVTLNWVANVLYLLIFNVIPLIYYVYVIAICYPETKHFRQIKWYCYLPYAASALLILTTPVTKMIFYITDDNRYFHGPLFIFLYVSTFIYLTMAIHHMYKMNRNLNTLQRISIYTFMLGSAFALLVQLIFPSLLLMEFATALAAYFILLSLENPYEYKDSQTEAFNREAFVKIIDDHISGMKKIVVLCLSIEGFKFINDKLGLNNGNKLLEQVSNYLLEVAPKNSLFHITGTQFGILLSSDYDSEALIEIITNRFKKPFMLNGMEIRLWMYMSCLIYPDNVSSLNDILDTVDYSLTEARNTSSTVITHGSAELLRKKHRENAIYAAINEAILTESFQVFYQPIYNADTGSFNGAEALIRLFDPDLGMISPEEFIPMVERNGTIIQIGDIVFKKVCQFLSSKILPNPQYSDFKYVHVNLSVVQCMQEDLVKHYTLLMKEYNIPPSMINFEITETVAYSYGDQLHNVITGFENAGIHFSLDDYGTGYSNAVNVMAYHYNIIKLDKSLLWACSDSHQAQSFLKYTIAMMQELDLVVLMEGVETPEQYRMLAKMGVHLFQGFYFSKPVPEEEFLPLLGKTCNL
ncbi:MAG: EAL domain-containing protein [Lachnospiraceae bacterium]|nr:EAL domain-containing protein [Lachnospiraceae bacterium]